MGDSTHPPQLEIPIELPENKEVVTLSEAIFRNKKRRRESSDAKKYIGDHIGCNEIPEYQEIIHEFHGEQLLFADRLSRLTDRSHMAESIFFILTNHFCVFNARLQTTDTIPTYEIALIKAISTSKENDNAIVIHLDDYRSELLMTPFKAELVATIARQYHQITNHELSIEFSNVIRIPVSPEADFEINFVRSSSGVRMTLYCVAPENKTT